MYFRLLVGLLLASFVFTNGLLAAGLSGIPVTGTEPVLLERILETFCASVGAVPCACPCTCPVSCAEASSVDRPYWLPSKKAHRRNARINTRDCTRSFLVPWR